MCLSCHIKSNLQGPGCSGKNNSNSARDWASPETWELRCLLLSAYQAQRNLLSSLIYPGLYCSRCTFSDKVNPFWRVFCSFLILVYRKKHWNLYFPCFSLTKSLQGTAYGNTVPFIVEPFTLCWGSNVIEKKADGNSEPQENGTTSERTCLEQSKRISVGAVVALSTPCLFFPQSVLVPSPSHLSWQLPDTTAIWFRELNG